MKTKFWLTDIYAGLDVFLIIPFSKMYNIWSVVMFITIGYDTFMVPYSIAVNFDFYGVFYAIDVLAILIYAFDIFIRSRTSITSPHTFCLNQHEVMRYYINHRLIFDLLSCLPFEYLLLFLGNTSAMNMSLIRYLRLFRLLKWTRLYE